MIHEPSNAPMAKRMAAKCVCRLSPHVGLFPVCESFTDTHPIAEHSGKACGTKTDTGYCGHEQKCHTQNQPTRSNNHESI